PYSQLSQDTMRLLMDYDWPGNVRELENLIKRTVVLGSEAGVKKDIAHGLAMTQHRSPAADSRLSLPRLVAAVGSMPGPLAAPLPAEAAPPQPANCSLKDVSRTAARGAEKDLIFRMLQQTRWNRKETAEILGISYKALLYKIKDAGLDKAPTP